MLVYACMLGVKARRCLRSKKEKRQRMPRPGANDELCSVWAVAAYSHSPNTHTHTHTHTCGRGADCGCGRCCRADCCGDGGGLVCMFECRV